eukprot:PhF_6_TR4206/c1_g1_i1/m.5659/K02937/RP-L7e, RPL7; large subunit ribosomal protein L7e
MPPVAPKPAAKTAAKSAPRAPESAVKASADKQGKLAKAIEIQKKAAVRSAAKYKDIVKRGTAAGRAQRRQERAVRNWRRVAGEQSKYFVEPGAKVAFVVRTRGIHKVAPRPRKILTLFRLRQINNGVFVKLNKATIPMLRMIEPWITYGQVTPATVRKLVGKRGYLKIDKKRVRIANNDIVTKAFQSSKAI